MLGFALTLLIFTTRLLTNPGGLQAGFVDPLWIWTLYGEPRYVGLQMGLKLGK